MKFSTVATVIMFALATSASAIPVQEQETPNFRSVRAAKAEEGSSLPQTNAERFALGLPPLKPRSMGTRTSAAKRQEPSNMRRDDSTLVRRQQPSNMRRAPVRAVYVSDRDRYAGVYAA